MSLSVCDRLVNSLYMKHSESLNRYMENHGCYRFRKRGHDNSSSYLYFYLIKEMSVHEKVLLQALIIKYLK